MTRIQKVFRIGHWISDFLFDPVDPRAEALETVSLIHGTKAAENSIDQKGH